MLSDELISAYLDGELDAERRALVERHLQNDSGAAARLERMRGSDALLKAALPAFDAPEDDALAASILRGSQPQPSRREWAVRLAGLAAAAVMGLSLGQFVPGARETSSPYALSAPEVRFLDTQLSGQTAQTEVGRLAMTLSVRGEDGAVCREYRLTRDAQSTEVLACRNGADGWRMVAAAATQQAEGYVPAGSDSPLDAAIAQLGASEALAPSQEQALIERNWR